MVKNKKIIIALIISVCVMSAFLILTKTDNKLGKESQYTDKVKLKFANNFISCIIEDKEGMSFNIFGVQNIKDRDSSLMDVVSSIELNNPNIRIVDYQVDTGIVHKNYKLVNILVTLKPLTNNVETADQLLIQFNNENKETYDIGSITVQNDMSYQNKHFEPSGQYTVAYPYLGLDINLRNKTDQTISPSRISDLTKNLSYQFDKPFEFQPHDKKHIKINTFYKGKKEFDFMTVSPILSYTLDNERYLYNMPGVVYGILDSDTDKIEKMIK
ncbi:hypothetical protein [Peribacillus frigoritolerans]|uniref:hypothetical protein n=1 Tax=Peribacillus frigoritolerans TaxID=450367 RepID=UPI00207A2C65|nr:hypothetical protein [Peribacillus frigoritolerans]USK74377.1 hypothetical protein LIT31_21705 [Peribacillus frigoritolerans]